MTFDKELFNKRVNSLYHSLRSFYKVDQNEKRLSDILSVPEKSDDSPKQLNPSEKLSNTFSKMLTYTLRFGSVLLLINFAFAFSFYNPKGKFDLTFEFGQFGDFFGGIFNPILTFITFFGVIITIIIQSRELQQARYEYTKTADALATQAVENTFFNMLDAHNKIVDSLRYNADELCSTFLTQSQIEHLTDLIYNRGKKEFWLDNQQGRSVFYATVKLIRYRTSDSDTPFDRYNKIQGRHNHFLGHYFRNLYQIISFIDNFDNKKLKKEQKHKYIKILRAQISSYELELLTLNCLENVVDDGEFRKLLIKYKFLEHINIHAKTRFAPRRLSLQSGIELSERQVLQYVNLVQVNDGIPKVESAFGTNNEFKVFIDDYLYEKNKEEQKAPEATE